MATTATGGPARLAEHVPGLDGLRGVAIAAVVAFHANAVLPVTGAADRVVANLANAGYLGVDLFFVLSGFLITGILLDAKGGGPTPARYYQAFYARRALRILPLYYAAVATLMWIVPQTGLLGPAERAVLSADQPWYWLHGVNVLYAVRGAGERLAFGTVHFWSLAVEEQFYLLWPLAVATLSTRALRGVCVAMLGIAVASRALAWGLGEWWGYAVLLPGRMDGLAVGAWLASAARDESIGAGLERFRAKAPAVARRVLIALLVVALMERGFDERRPAMHTVGYALAAVAFGALLVATVTGPARWPRLKVLRWLGRYSYGIYVVHLPILAAFARAGGLEPLVAAHATSAAPAAVRLGLMAALGVAACALAWLSWHAWEKHWLALKRLVPRAGAEPRLAPAPVAVPTAALAPSSQ